MDDLDQFCKYIEPLDLLIRTLDYHNYVDNVDKGACYSSDLWFADVMTDETVRLCISPKYEQKYIPAVIIINDNKTIDYDYAAGALYDRFDEDETDKIIDAVIGLNKLNDLLDLNNEYMTFTMSPARPTCQTTQSYLHIDNIDIYNDKVVITHHK